MSEINENTAAITEPIEKTGSSSDAVSFDDLENLMSQPKKEAKEEPDEKTEKVEDEPKKEADSDPKKKEAKDDKSKKPDEEAAVDKTAVIKMKNGDAELDVPRDAKVTVKIDGKDEEFTVQELVNEFSGKTSWNRKFGELDKERREFHAERDELQSTIDELHDLAVKQMKPYEAIQFLTDLVGGDGSKMVQELREKMLKEAAEWNALTEEQRETRKAQQERDLIAAKVRRNDAVAAKQKEQTVIAKRIDDVKTKYNMTDERFKEVYEAIKRGGKTPVEQLTPELVGDVHERWTHMDAVDEIIDTMKLDEQTANSAKSALLKEWWNDRDLTREQIQRVATSLFGTKSSKKPASTLAEKIKRSGVNTNTNKSERVQKFEAVTFDDLD